MTKANQVVIMPNSIISYVVFLYCFIFQLTISGEMNIGSIVTLLIALVTACFAIYANIKRAQYYNKHMDDKPKLEDDEP